MDKVELNEEKDLINLRVTVHKIEVDGIPGVGEGRTVNLKLGFSHADMGIPYAGSMEISEKENVKGFVVHGDILYIRVGKVAV